MYKIINNICVYESILTTGIVHRAVRDLMREEGGGGTLYSNYCLCLWDGGRG